MEHIKDEEIITFFVKLAKSVSIIHTIHGGVAERLNVPVSKTGRGESSSGVRISPPPQ